MYANIDWGSRGAVSGELTEVRIIQSVDHHLGRMSAICNTSSGQKEGNLLF